MAPQKVPIGKNYKFDVSFRKGNSNSKEQNMLTAIQGTLQFKLLFRNGTEFKKGTLNKDIRVSSYPNCYNFEERTGINIYNKNCLRVFKLFKHTLRNRMFYTNF